MNSNVSPEKIKELTISFKENLEKIAALLKNKNTLKDNKTIEPMNTYAYELYANCGDIYYSFGTRVVEAYNFVEALKKSNDTYKNSGVRTYSWVITNLRLVSWKIFTND